LSTAFFCKQEARKDPRPLDAGLVAPDVERQKQHNGCHTAFDDGALRRQVETHLRVQRTMRELIGEVPKPTQEHVRRFGTTASRVRDGDHRSTWITSEWRNHADDEPKAILNWQRLIGVSACKNLNL